MKMQIELDLEKIDYDSINKQIQEKISNIDLKKEYDINSKIVSSINEEVEREVSTSLGYYGFGELDKKTKDTIKKVINESLIDLVKTRVEEIFDKISQNELDDIISCVISETIVKNVQSTMYNVMGNYRNNIDSRIYTICENKIRSIVSRY